MSILTDQNSEFAHLYHTISLYNNMKDKCYISKDLKIQFDTKEKDQKKISDKEIFTIFIKRFQNEINDMVDLKKNFLTSIESEKIIDQLKVFVKNSSELSNKENDFELLESLTKTVLKKAVGICELIQEGDTRKLTPLEFEKIHRYIKKAAEERIMARDIIFHSYLEYLQLLIIQEIKKYDVTITRKAGYSPVINWDNAAVSPEEFAINSTLEKASQKSLEHCRTELVKVYEKTGMQPVIKLWQLYFAHQKIFDIAHKLFKHYELAHDHAANETFVLPEFQRIYKNFIETGSEYELHQQVKANETVFIRSQKSSNEELYTFSIEYNQALKTIKETYHTAYIFYQAELSNYNSYVLELNPVFGKQLLSPEEFNSIHVPETTPHIFQSTFSSNLDALLTMTMNDNDALVFKTVQAWLYGDSNHEFVDFHPTFCRDLRIPIRARLMPEQDILAYRIEHMKITTATPLKPISNTENQKTNRKKVVQKQPAKKVKNHSKTERPREVEKKPEPTVEVIESIKEKSLPPLMPIAPVVTKKCLSIKTAERITVDPRVRDWLKIAPETLKQNGYATLSLEQQQEAKLFHSYPIVVTKLMRQYGKSTPRISNKTKQNNVLFSYPGTIERYGTAQKPIEGYFADCFDEKTNNLYHHYFHARPFQELLRRYKTSSSYLTNQEESEIRSSKDVEAFFFPQKNEPIEEENIYDKLNITVRHYSIEVDDTEKQIKYTLSFPEGVNTLL